jgi:hypothetical protein
MRNEHTCSAIVFHRVFRSAAMIMQAYFRILGIIPAPVFRITRNPRVFVGVAESRNKVKYSGRIEKKVP